MIHRGGSVVEDFAAVVEIAAVVRSRLKSENEEFGDDQLLAKEDK